MATRAQVPQVIVCLGGGGVGKTSASAAIAVACAGAGLKTLAVTLDPARRLAEALAAHRDNPLLTVFEPEAQSETRALAASLFDVPTRRRLAGNRIFRALAQGLAGMEDLASIAGLGTHVAGHAFDVVVVDTAPSRNAIRAIGLAGRVLAAVDSRVLLSIGRLFARPSARGIGARLLAFASQPVARVLESAVGRGPVDEVIELLEVLIGARSRLAAIAREAEGLLASVDTRFVVVTSPSENALATALHLGAELARAGRTPDAFVLNRAAGAAPPWLIALGHGATLPPELRDAVTQLRVEAEGLRAATAHAHHSLATAWPGRSVWLHPDRRDEDARDVVAGLAVSLAPMTRALLARPVAA